MTDRPSTTLRDDLLADLHDLERTRDRLADATPVSEEARARRDDCLASYRRSIGELRNELGIPWLRERPGGFVIEDRL